jgi:hypothetical protein
MSTKGEDPRQFTLFADPDAKKRKEVYRGTLSSQQKKVADFLYSLKGYGSTRDYAESKLDLPSGSIPWRFQDLYDFGLILLTGRKRMTRHHVLADVFVHVAWENAPALAKPPEDGEDNDSQAPITQ